jgi:maltose/moltooligosaccharide transporter
MKQSKPLFSTAQIINMSVGFLGIQFGFALQNGNASRILQTFGADVHELGWFWLAAPLTGMIVQPIIGVWSDKTWSAKWGRRKPFFLVGAILATFALVFLPNSASLSHLLPPVLMGALILMFMDASFNVAMEPFRALVADNLDDSQATKGFSIQTVLIGIGAVIGSWLPYVLAEWFGVEKVAAEGQVPKNVLISFYIGAFTFMAAIIWTIVTTKEYSPEERTQLGIVEETHEQSGFAEIVKGFTTIPAAMKQMGLVQFFSWIGLFSMWVYMTPALAHHVYKLPLDDNKSLEFNNAGNWVGILFGVYNGVSALYALLLPKIAGQFGKKQTHAFSLLAGALGLISIYFIDNPTTLLISMIGVGMAWASILAMPYAIIAKHIPSSNMGLFMGIFNIFITLPQIVNALIGGPILKYAFNNLAIYSIVFGGVSFIIAALLALRIKDE